MKRTTIAAAASAADHRPNRLLIALAAAWMIGSLAIGGAVAADSQADASAPSSVTRTASQP